jgi:non-ribosomal peptide synthetase component F
MGSHGEVLNRIGWAQASYPLDSSDVIAQKTSLNFVDSLAEVFLPFVSESPAFFIPDNVVRDGSRLRFNRNLRHYLL